MAYQGAPPPYSATAAPPYPPGGPGAPPAVMNQPGPGGFYMPDPNMAAAAAGPPPPVQMQPMAAPPMDMRPDNCPPGLEYLTQIDQLIVKQKVELMEAFLGCETKNKYKIKNSMGQEVYKAKEETDCCTRQCCGPMRPFDMTIKDNQDQEVIHLYRPLNCQSCLFPCCLQFIEVSSPPGTVIGTVEQEWSLCEPQFAVRDSAGEVALRIEGPFCTFSLCGDVEFKITSPDGSMEVGKISKHWSGAIREAFTDSDNFGISFPMDLDVRMKATLLGALFLIDFMFFEKAKNEESDGLGMF